MKYALIFIAASAISAGASAGNDGNSGGANSNLAPLSTLLDSCNLVDSPDASVLFPNKTKGGSPTAIYPAYAIQKVLFSKGLPALDLTTANVSILDEPKHGRLQALKILESESGRGYQYLPIPDYRGADFVIALVEYKGQRTKVIMKLVVVDAVIDNTEGAPGGYRNGNSGGGAIVDKLANDCEASYEVRLVGASQSKKGRGSN